MARRKQQDVTENPLYHDTWKLLQKYRDVVWSMELSVQQVKISFEKEFGQTIDDFLDSIYSAGADLSGTEIEQHARCIQRSNQMIKLVDGALDILRYKHRNGEELYWILYYTCELLQEMNIPCKLPTIACQDHNKLSALNRGRIILSGDYFRY